jgi:hypothetical protein
MKTSIEPTAEDQSKKNRRCALLCRPENRTKNKLDREKSGQQRLDRERTRKITAQGNEQE